jgi:hypothetical protein
MRKEVALRMFDLTLSQLTKALMNLKIVDLNFSAVPLRSL